MKQITLAIATLLTANLGFSASEAATAAANFASDNSPNTLSAKQQKAIFAFSRERATMTMDLIERWDGAPPADRQTMTAEFVATFYGALKDHAETEAIASELGTSLLMADVLGNAKYLIAEKGTVSSERLDRVVEAVKAAVMRECHASRGEIVFPYVPQKLAWGQHGQHFPNA